MQKKNLSTYQVNHFLQYGYIHLEECFDIDSSKDILDSSMQRLKEDKAALEYSNLPLVHLKGEKKFSPKSFAPKAWNAICDLLGGEDKIKHPTFWSDNFIINYSLGKYLEWLPPSQDSRGWHIDGDFFWHFLDSPEQALLVIMIWEDIGHRGGGTFLALDSIKFVSDYLIQHPEGVHPFNKEIPNLVKYCKNFYEVTGKAGDVFLIHPFMLHASSQNHSGKPRFITNPFVSLNDPMNFNRHNENKYSLVEKKILLDLGKESIDFQIQSKRRAFDHSSYKYLEYYWSDNM